MKPLLPFLIAVQFLTRFPVRLRATPGERDLGRSLLYYPLVGLLFGLLLAGVGLALGGQSGLLGGALLLAVWVLGSGGLHLDGLADSADALVGGLGDRERTLAIMKDPHCGPAAVVALVLVLLLKCAALTVLLERGAWSLIAVAPLLGRCALPALFLTTPYVRPGGLGDVLARQMPRRATLGIVAVSLLAVAAVLGTAGLWPLLAALAVFIALRAAMIRRLGGTTGDSAGALVELLEAAVLVTAALG